MVSDLKSFNDIIKLLVIKQYNYTVLFKNLLCMYN